MQARRRSGQEPKHPLAPEQATGTTPERPPHIDQATWDEVRRILRADKSPFPVFTQSMSDSEPGVSGREDFSDDELTSLAERFINDDQARS